MKAKFKNLELNINDTIEGNERNIFRDYLNGKETENKDCNGLNGKSVKALQK